MSSRIPPLLEPYLILPPEASLVLLTSVLGASSNWLVLRFLHSALQTPDVVPEPSSGGGDTKVLLVSFMRDLAFWKENARRLGLDLDKLMAKKRFAFVDGLSGLHLPTQRAVPGRGGPIVLSNPVLTAISDEVQQAVEKMKLQDDASKVLLVVDQLDLLLATAGEGMSAVEIDEMLLGLREHVHSTVVTLSADSPLVSNQQTPLESNHAAVLLGTAHEADCTMSLRLLDSGTARDVSGVISITAGNQVGEMGQEARTKVEEKELLYFVGGDGGVKVFERGQ